ncbi:MAG: Polysaccharide biosynthesis protein [Synergistales bacterium 53_16]|nr:MAG: Polysaccharide biosynthesis protein [Synergistales bacterium 53_16]
MTILGIAKVREKLAKALPKSKTVRSISVLAGGTATAQFINILFAPLLTRVYSPADFGVLSAYTAILALLLAFSGLGYHLAIPLPKANNRAFNLLVLSMILHLLLCLLVATAIFFVPARWVRILKWESLQPYFWLIPLGFAGGGFYNILNYWAVREKAFGVISRTRMAQSIFGGIAQIFLGYIGLRPIGLLIGQFINRTAGILSLTSTFKDTTLRFPQFHRLKYVAKRYRRFPLYSSWGTLLNTASAQVTPILLVSWYSESIAGWFSLGNRLINLPLLLIGASVSQVYFQKASASRFSGNTANVTEKFFKALAIVGIFPLIAIAIIAPNLFSTVFGKDWAISGLYVRFLAPYLIFQVLASPLSTVFFAMERQRTLLVFQAFLLITRVTSLYSGRFFETAEHSILFYGVASAAAYCVYLLLILNISGNKLTTPMRFIGKIFVQSALLLLPCLYFQIIEKEILMYSSAFLGSCAFLFVWRNYLKALFN